MGGEAVREAEDEPEGEGGASAPAPEGGATRRPPVATVADDPEVVCPSCGRFAGTYERCPYCGAGMRVRLSVKILRRISLCVGILGVLVLWMAARHLEVPRVRIGDFSPTHNFAILQVRGKVVSGPYYGDRGDSFYAGIDDGTGRINVRAYGDTARELRDLDLQRNDRVEVRGSIRVQQGKPPGMALAVRRHLRVLERAPTPPEPKIVPIEDVTRDMAGAKLKVRVQGTLYDVYENRAGKGGTLRDATGTLTLWAFKNTMQRMGDGADLLVEGRTLEVDGRLDLYSRRLRSGETREIVQILPGPWGDSVRESDAGPFPPPEEEPGSDASATEVDDEEPGSDASGTGTSDEETAAEAGPAPDADEAAPGPDEPATPEAGTGG